MINRTLTLLLIICTAFPLWAKDPQIPADRSSGRYKISDLPEAKRQMKLDKQPGWFKYLKTTLATIGYYGGFIFLAQGSFYISNRGSDSSTIVAGHIGGKGIDRSSE